MESGYPELISYKFIESKVYFTDLCILTEENSLSLCNANFRIAFNLIKYLSKWIPKKRNQKVLYARHFFGDKDEHSIEPFPYPPKRGWNHGDNVGEMITEFHKRQKENHAEQFYQWLKTNIQLEKYINKQQKSSSYLKHKFPKSNTFKFHAELIEIKWQSVGIGFPDDIQYHIINLTF